MEPRAVADADPTPDGLAPLPTAPAGPLPETQRATLPGPVSLRRIQELLTYDGPALEVMEPIAKGANGTVLSARQVRLNRTVAVKVPRRDDAAAVGSVVQEAYVAAYLDHPNIVPVHDIVLHDGRPCVVMKRIDGVPWSELVEHPTEVVERFGVADPLEWHLRTLVSVCRAIEFAHDRGVLHGDLKPANVMIGRFGEVWVVDWGNALALPGSEVQLRQASTVVHANGTPSHMAPEQARGDGARLSERSDVFGLGALLFEIITGRLPRDGTVREVLARAGYEAIEVDPSWPLGSLLRDALALDPAQRVASVAAFRARIEAFLGRRGAEKVLESARRRLQRLEALLDGEAVDRVALYDAFGACRFGFEAALQVWPGHRGAQQGLERALLRMVDHELGEGDERAAALLLASVDAPPPELARRVETLREEKVEAEALLQAVAEDRSSQTAWFARFVVMSGLGSVWVATPVGSWLVGIPHGFGRELAISGATFVLSLMMMAALWRWLIRSQLNRVLITMVAAGPGLAFLLNVGLWVGGYDTRLSNPLELFVYFTCALVVVILAEAWLLPGALAFLAAFFLSLAFEGTSLLWMNLANLLVVINAAVVWGVRAARGGDGPMDLPMLRR